MMDQIYSQLAELGKDKAPRGDGLVALNKSNLMTGNSILKMLVDKREANLRLTNYPDDNNISFNLDYGISKNLKNIINITDNNINIKLPLIGDSFIFNKDITANSNLNLGQLNVINNSIFNNDITANTNLHVENSIQTKEIKTIDDNSESFDNQTLNIIGKYINIGNKNSNINIYGTTTYIATTELVVKDKILTLNLNEDNITPLDIGFNTGIQIAGTNDYGYIKTNSDASRYLIKAPESNENYIATIDLNNNLTISGKTFLNEDVTLFSNLYIDNNLLVNNNTILNQDTTILSNLYISGNTICGNPLSLLNVSNDERNLLNNLTEGSIIYNKTTQKLNIYLNNYWSEIANSEKLNINGDAIIDSVTILSNLSVSEDAYIYGDLTIFDNVNISKNTI